MLLRRARSTAGRASVLALIVASLLVLVSIAGAPGAAAAPSNLIANPGAESGQGASESGQVFAPPDWTVTGEFTAVQYGASGGFPTYEPEGEVSRSLDGGVNFFAGGNSEVSTATQTVDVAASASAIDAGAETASLSGDLGGYSGQGDNMVVTASYLSEAGARLGSLSIGPVGEAEREGHTTLLPRSTSGAVPAGTRSIQVLMTSTRLEGEYDDGYADNLSLTLEGPQATPQAHPQAFGPSGIVQAPSSAVCLSRRSFTIHIRKLAGLVYRKVSVQLDGHQLEVTKGASISALVNLRGQPRGTYVVKITVLTSTGAKITGTRTYHTCRAHPTHPHQAPKL
jgi:hypothetical protein